MNTRCKFRLGRSCVITTAGEEVGIDADNLFAKGVIHPAGEEASLSYGRV